MSGLSLNQKPRLPRVARNKQAVASVVRVPARRVLGSTGTSVLVHGIAISALSLFFFAQKEMPVRLMAEARFDDQPGDREGSLEFSELDLPEIEAAITLHPELVSFTEPDPGLNSADVDVNLAAFRTESANSSGQNLPDGIAAIASGIQQRVAQAGGRKGVVQFSLAWRGLNDVDLHVITPSGEHISYSQPTSSCKGTLDVDMNASEFSEEPVENVRWLNRTAPIGRYTIIVHQFHWSGRSRDPFQLLVNLGDRTEVVEQEVNSSRPVSIHRFQYVGSSLTESRRTKLVAEFTKMQAQEEAEASAILKRGLAREPGPDRDRVMLSIIARFPHTDASISAMQELNPPDKFGN